MGYADTLGRSAREGDAAWAWLLTVEFAGKVYRWASADLGPVAELAGERVPVRPGLGAGHKVVHALGLSSDVAPPAMSFEVHFPDEVNVAANEWEGHPLAGAPAEVALVPLGSGDATLADRIVAHRGFVSQPQFGGIGEPVAFTVRGFADDLDREIPSATERVTPETWPSARTEELGRPYPLPWGRPGLYRDDDGNSIVVPAVPAVVVEYEFSDPDNFASTLLIASGHVQAASVVLWYKRDDIDGGWGTVTASTVKTTDGLDQPVSVLDVSGSSDAIRTAGEYYVDFRQGAGLPGDDAAPLAGAGTVALWWLRRTSIPTDYARSIQAASLLDAFRSSGHVDDVTTPRDWLYDHVVTKLPASLAQAAAGLYLAPVRWQATAAEATALLVEGENGVVREEPIEIVGDGRATEVRVRWARDLRSDEYRNTSVWSSNPTGAAYQRALTGLRPLGRTEAVRTVSVDLDYCWDRATAMLVAEYTAWREALPRREVEVVLASDMWGGRISEGDVVIFRSESLGIAAVALVGSLTLSDRAWWPARLILLRPESR